MNKEDQIFDLLTIMHNDIQVINTRLDKLENSVLHIEFDNGRKLDALFDGYKQNTELLRRIEDKVTKHDDILLHRIK